MKLIVVFAAILAASVPGRQPQLPPQNHKSLPTLKKDSWAIGNNIYVDASYERVDYGGHWYTVDICDNVCKGGIHYLHESCDLSCDNACTKYHVDHVDANSNPTGGDVGDRIEKGAQKMGASVTGIRDVVHAMENKDRNTVKGQAQYRMTLPTSHFNKTPCSIVYRHVKMQIYAIYVSWQLYRYDTGPEGRQIRVNGPEGTDIMATTLIPEGEYEDTPPKITCRCSIVREKTGTGADDEHSSTGGLKVEDSNGSYACDNKTQSSLQISCVVNDINTCTISATNPTTMSMTLVVDPGTMLVCNDHSSQDMVVLSQLRLRLPAKGSESVMVPFDGPRVEGKSPPVDSSDSVGGTARIACTQMTKPAPEASSNYHFEPCTSTPLKNVCELYNSERVHLPLLGQVRTWIITDHATYDDVCKHLVLHPSSGGYVRALLDVNTAGMVDLTGPDFAKLLQPRLVAGDRADSNATNWFVNAVAQVDPAGLANWVQANSAAFDALWTDNDGHGVQHGADLANQLCRSMQPGVRAAGLAFLTKTVPKEKRAALAKDGGLSGAGTLLFAENAEEAAAGLEVLKLYGPKSSEFFLRNISTGLPQALRDRARSELVQGGLK